MATAAAPAAVNGGGKVTSQAYLESIAVKDTRVLIADLCRQFYNLGWVSGTGGSITIKVHDDSIPKPQQLILMSPSACGCSGLVLFALSYVGVPCLHSFTYRRKLRAQYSLPAEPCPDFCVHCCCLHCALCQEYRELKNRGLDPSLGWVANAEKMYKGGAMAPPAVPQDMPR